MKTLQNNFTTPEQSKTKKETQQAAAGYIARQMKEKRKEKGWTLYRLEKESGVTSGHLAKIEKGYLTPRADILHRICEALKMEIAFPLPI